MKPIPLYELILDDYTRYYGGDLANPFWRESPDKAILFLKLKLQSGDFLQLGGYDEYNFFVEAVSDFFGSAEKGTRLTYMYAMGCKDNAVTSYRIALDNNGQGTGDITVRYFPKGKEYNGKPTSGWHKGH